MKKLFYLPVHNQLAVFYYREPFTHSINNTLALSNVNIIITQNETKKMASSRCKKSNSDNTAAVEHLSCVHITILQTKRSKSHISIG
jgi:hypothetical protein